LLTGNFFNSIDAKGRAFVPTKLGFAQEGRIWIVKGIDKCLCLYSQKNWEAFTERYINNGSDSDPNARKLKRFVLGYSRELEIDKQGRINIPQDHLDYAGIVKDIVFVGCGDKAELWSKERFDKEMAEDSFDPNELMQSAENAKNSRGQSEQDE